MQWKLSNRFSWELYKTVRQDWFALLNQGHHITGTGNSDSHSLEVEQIGFPANFVPCSSSEGDPQNYDMSCLVTAVQKEKLFVSNGQIINLTVENNEQTASLGEQISNSGEAYLVATIKAVDWVPVEEAQIIINGNTVKTIEISSECEPDGSLQLEFRFPLQR